MRYRLLCVLGGILLSAAAANPAWAACTAEQTTQQRDLQAALKDTVSELKRAESRLRGQTRRLEGLAEADPISDAPEAPERNTPSFNARGKLTLDCENPDGVDALLTMAADEVLVFSVDVEAFAAAVDSREAEVVALEEAAEAAPETAEQAPEGDSGTADAGQADAATPGTAEGGDAQADEGEGGQEQAGPAPEAADGDQGGDQDGATPPEETAKAPEPLKVDGNEIVYQRLLTLPDAVIVAEPGAEPEGDDQTPDFSVLYVYGRDVRSGADWIQVGPGVTDGPIGWIREDQTLAWNSALVMQFAPVGRRERVLFFRDSGDLIDVISDFQFATEAKSFYEKLREGTLDEDRFVAAEPGTAVRYADEPYLLPIIDHIEEAFDDASEVTLVKVASVSLKTESLPTQDTESLGPEEEEAPADLSEFRIGITFVIDSTASMGPYIARTYDAVQAIYQRFEGISDEVQAAFGLIAYRDNFEHDDRIGYVTDVVQPLDPAANPRTILANIESVRPSRAATIDWREDAYAGIAEAIEGFDWSPYAARIVILITDAGAREGAEKLASRTDLTTSVLVQDAVAKNVAIVPIHLITPEAERQNDVGRAEAQYRMLSQTGDENNQKYLAVDASSDAEFAREIDDAARFLADEVLRLARATAAPEGNDGDAQSEAPAVNDGTLKSDDGALDPAVLDDADRGGAEAGPRGRLAKVLATEILRARLEYLGGRDDATAPSFISGWAADRDLTDPEKRTLKFSIFLTRNQISALAQSVEQLVDAFRSAGTSPGAFFDQLQLVAAKTARDPDLVKQDEKAAVREILPSFIQGLPYLSEVLRLDRELWEQFSTADRENFVEGLEEKLRVYNRLYEQTENWVDFGAADPALEAYAMPLDQLP